MKLVIDDDLRTICKTIVDRYSQCGDDSLVWSDDQYQQGAFCGGWAPNGFLGPAFYFSYYAPDGHDYIFSFSLSDAVSVAGGGVIDPLLTYWKPSPDW